MKRWREALIGTGLLALLLLCGCSRSEQLQQEEGGNMFRQKPDTFTENPEHTEESIFMEKTEAEGPGPATLLYQGNGWSRQGGFALSGTGKHSHCYR